MANLQHIKIQPGIDTGVPWTAEFIRLANNWETAALKQNLTIKGKINPYFFEAFVEGTLPSGGTLGIAVHKQLQSTEGNLLALDAPAIYAQKTSVRLSPRANTKPTCFVSARSNVNWLSRLTHPKLLQGVQVGSWWILSTRNNPNLPVLADFMRTLLPLSGYQINKQGIWFEQRQLVVQTEAIEQLLDTCTQLSALMHTSCTS